MEFNKTIKCITGEVANNYKLYLNTRHWRSLRVIIYNSKNKSCEICKKSELVKFEVHHKSYKRIGKEQIKDLQLLCVDCHTELHRKKNIAKSKSKVTNCKKCNTPLKNIKSFFYCPKCDYYH